MSISDQILEDYLHGTLRADEVARVEAALAEGDKDVETRLMALDPAAKAVKQAFDSLEMPQDQTDRIQTNVERFALPQTANVSNEPKGWALAATLVVGALIGGLGFEILRPTPSALPNWRAEVAAYQALYVPETLASADLSTLDAQFQRAEAAFGRSLPWEAFATPDGLTLSRVQVLGQNGAPLIQVAYKDANGVPFALCFMRGEDDVADLEHLSGLASVSWSADGNRFLLIGGSDLEQIDAFAAPIKDALS